MHNFIFDLRLNTYLFKQQCVHFSMLWYNFSMFNYWNKIVFIIIIDLVNNVTFCNESYIYALREVFVWIYLNSVKPYRNYLNTVRDTCIWTLFIFTLKNLLCNYKTISFKRFRQIQFYGFFLVTIPFLEALRYVCHPLIQKLSNWIKQKFPVLRTKRLSLQLHRIRWVFLTIFI